MNDLEHKIVTLETFSLEKSSKAEQEEIRRDLSYLKGIVGALLDYLDVYPHKELVVDNRFMPPEIKMTEVFRIKHNKNEKRK